MMRSTRNPLVRREVWSTLLTMVASVCVAATAPPPVEVARARLTVSPGPAGELVVSAGGDSGRVPVVWEGGEARLVLGLDPGTGRFEASLVEPAGATPGREARSSVDGVGSVGALPVSLLELRFTVAAQDPPPDDESKEEAAARERVTPVLRVAGLRLTDAGGARNLHEVEVTAGRTVTLVDFAPEMGSGLELVGLLTASGEPAAMEVEVRLLAASRVAVAKEGLPWAGTVRSLDEALVCGPDCKQAVAFVAPDARLELVAEAAPESDGSLGDWFGDCTPVAADRAILIAPSIPGSASCEVAISGDAPVDDRWEEPEGSYSNPTTITIPGVGAASPYPSAIVVEQAGGSIIDVEIILSNVAHTYPDDLDVLLWSPAGSGVVLMSDACGGEDVNGRTWTFFDAAPEAMPDEGPCTAPFYRPTNYESGDTWPTPAPNGPYFGGLSHFVGDNPNGHWQLWVNDDDAGDQGSIAGGWTLTLQIDPAAVVIPASGTAGIATPYPSHYSYQTTPLGPIFDLNLRIEGATHSYPDDLDLLLVSPAGTAVVVMSDACGMDDVTNHLWRFDDQAAAMMPDDGPCTAVDYRPSEYQNGDAWPAPAPAGPYSAVMDAFSDENPFGDWLLFALDDAAGDTGYLLDGWELEVTTGPVMVAIPGSGTAGAGAPYPVEISLPFGGRIVDIGFGLFGLSHTYPDDLEVLLQAPDGTAVLLMADACGGASLNNADLQFADGAAILPDGGPCPSGTYRPTAHGGASFPPPAPQGPYATFLGAFYGEGEGNGIWKVWVNDDAGGDAGYSTAFVMSLTISFDLLFADGFEEGNTSDWSGTVP